jgi:hypothetical protein
MTRFLRVFASFLTADSDPGVGQVHLTHLKKRETVPCFSRCMFAACLIRKLARTQQHLQLRFCAWPRRCAGTIAGALLVYWATQRIQEPQEPQLLHIC